MYMKRYLRIGAVVLLLLMAFLAGYWISKGSSPEKASSGSRKILYYVDPMNPGHRYDKPGIAPCGMQLEPVYSDGEGTAPLSSSLPPDTVRVSVEKQQLIGVRVEEVEKASSVHTLRLLGRVAADETRIYRINAYVDGWIRKILPYSTGSQVKVNAPLAYFYAPELLTAQQTYVYTLGSQDRAQTKRVEGSSQGGQIKTNIQQYYDNLRNLGMTEPQIDELAKTKKLTQDIVISSPASGFIIARNVSPDQRFEKGAELFRIADLRRVWILLDSYENEARYFRPGQTVQVRYQGKVLPARVSSTLPQFDPATRTLKVRLEADNPGYLLRPDMFVDVEFPVRMPPAITVPADAVLDSGLKKTVFIDRGNGFFEPRKVETGRYFDDRVEIVKGLMPGERIVISGNFLIDSESRMRAASSGMSGTAGIDPACGMSVDQGKAKTAGLTSDYKGTTYFFCSVACKKQFDAAPRNYAEKQEKPQDQGHMPKNGGQHHD
jgi:RND family efflux transporter MFP subunit